LWRLPHPPPTQQHRNCQLPLPRRRLNRQISWRASSAGSKASSAGIELTLRSLSHVRVVLVRPQQAGNVGATARALANHGLLGMALVDPPAFDPELARWMAPGAHHFVDEAAIVGSVAEAVADCALVVGTTGRRRRQPWPVWDPATLLREVCPVDQPPRRTALVFGPEDAGLSTLDLLSCHAVLCLPTAQHASLNLAQAVTAALAGLAAGTTIQTSDIVSERGAAPAFDLAAHHRLVERALEALDIAGYLEGRNREQVTGTLFRLLGRSQADTVEASVLMGMVEQLRWAITDRPAG
jgi:tRNA (cytidine32/uridine32-2'-O)-methyltransferase